MWEKEKKEMITEKKKHSWWLWNIFNYIVIETFILFYIHKKSIEFGKIFLFMFW